MRDASHSPEDPILFRYLERIEKMNLPQDKEKEIMEIFRDYSRTVNSNPLGNIQEYNITDQIKTLFENYKLIASNLSDLFFILDEKLRFTFIAPSVEELMEYNYKELIGEGFDTLVPKWSGNNLSGKLNNLQEVKPDVKNPQKFTIQLSSKYGKLNWYEVQITAIFDSNNKMRGYNGVCRDINERLKYEEALRRAKSKAEESDRLKSAFLANMSHEIRTPLNGIIGFSTMLNNIKVSEEKRDKYSRFILSSSHQLLTIINDIIDISKIEARQLAFLNREYDLHVLLQEVLATGEVELMRLNKEHIKIKVELGQDKELFLNIDDTRLKQVLLNLVTNALKFTQKGTVTFGYEIISGNNLRFFVKDTGMGIPENIQRSIFDRFNQGDIDRKEKISGTGLGLAICKGIVEMLGGQIAVASEKDKGSEFYFSIPLEKYLIREKVDSED